VIVRPKLTANATLTGSAAVTLSIGKFGLFDIVRAEGVAKAEEFLAGSVKVNFDEKSATLDRGASGALLGFKYSLKYNINVLNLFDTSDPGDPPQYNPPPTIIPLFGGVPVKNKALTSGSGIGTNNPSSAPSHVNQRLTTSTLTLEEPLYNDSRRVQANLTIYANRLTPTPGQHLLDVVLESPTGDIVLEQIDLANATFATSAHPLGFETAVIPLDLVIPYESLDPVASYPLTFRLNSESDPNDEEVQITLNDINVIDGTPTLNVTSSGDLNDGGLDFGPDTAGLAQAVVNIGNTGTTPLTLGLLKLVGKGYELIDIPTTIVVEPGETYPLHVRLLNAALAANATLVVPSDDPTTPKYELPLRHTPGGVAQQVSFATPSAVVVEGVRGKLKVVLARPAQTTITVNYAVTGGSAVAGSDFTPFDGTLTFKKGQSVQYINVPTLGNLVHQANRSLNITLSNPTEASLGALSTLTFTIRDNDPLIEFASATAEAMEGSTRTKVLLPVVLSGSSLTPVTVSYRVIGGTATAKQDYLLATGKLVFAAGQIQKAITLTLLPDALVEPDETITIELFTPNGGVLGTISTLTFTLKDLVV
jgi:hypothetical protein